MKKYKRLMEGYTKSGALRYLAAAILLMLIDCGVNASILRLIPEAANSSCSTLLALIGGLCVVNTLVEWGRSNMNIYRHMAFTSLSNGYTWKMMTSDNAMFSEHSPGEIIDTGSAMWKFTNAAEQVVVVVNMAVKMTFTLIAIGTLNGADGTLVPIIGVYVIEVLAIYRANKTWTSIDNALDKIRRKRNIELDEISNGFQEVRSFPGQIDRHWKSITGSNSSIMDLARKRARCSGHLGLIVNICDTIASVGALAYALFYSAMPPSIAVTFVMLVWRLAEPAYSIGEILSQLSDSLSSVPKYNEIMDYENRVPDGTIKLASFDSAISLENVTFGYSSTENVLSGVSMTIKKGEHVGICGPFGCGKSTVCSLISRAYTVEPGNGSLSIDNVDIRDLTAESVRRHVGVIHQHPHIFEGTILKNITYGSPDATIDDVRRVCDTVGILDFIEGLDDKFSTLVGPRGLRLSGGQKQCIAVARVLLQNPDIIVMDEATSALDNVTERRLQKAIDSLDNKTIVMVAHRLTTLRNCDTIYVMNAHRIEESGSYDKLVKYGGVFADMVKASESSDT